MKRYSLVALVFLVVTSCSLAEPSEVEAWKLPKRLNEISGLASSKARIFTHNDEKGIVYEFDRLTGDVTVLFKISDPSIRADFEGIAVLDEDVYLVTSDGLIYWVKNALSATQQVVNADILETGLGELCEIEGLSSYRSNLYLVCKNNYRNSDVGHLLIFVYKVDSGVTVPAFRIPLENLGVKKLNPSGLSVRDEVIYVVSAKQRLLSVLTHEGELIQNYRLNKDLHRQTEGVIQSPETHLVLADEGKKKGGRISFYKAVIDLPLYQISKDE